MHKAWRGIEEVPYCFSRSYVKLQGRTLTKWSILTQIKRFRIVTPVWIHQLLQNDAQTWSNMEEVPYCFSRSYVKLQGHTLTKLSILTQIKRFRTVTALWIHQRLRNDAQCLKSMEEVSCCFSMSSVKFQGSHGTKNCQFCSELSVSGL